MSLERQMNRKATFASGNKWEGKIEEINEKLLETKESHRGMRGSFILHPRKGFRRVSVKRGRAQMLMAEQKVGKFPPSIFAYAKMAKFITTGLW